MTTIDLQNELTSSQIQTITVDLYTCICTLDDNTTLSLDELLTTHPFKHPLLDLAETLPAQTFYQYRYDDIDGMLAFPSYFFAFCLKNPNQAISFDVAPSAAYHANHDNDSIFISSSASHKAHKAISLDAFSELISKRCDTSFVYQDQIVYTDTLTRDDIAFDLVDQGILSQNPKIKTYLSKPTDIEQFECRYIHPSIGFGVFARTAIKANSIIGVYAGIKTAKQQRPLTYTFKTGDDCFLSYINAQHMGNITRFINHAPNKTGHFYCQTANVINKNIFAHGLEFVLFVAQRPIRRGEQLLIDYGRSYFQAIPECFFTPSNKLYAQWPSKTTKQQKVNDLVLLKAYGIPVSRPKGLSAYF